MVLRIGVVGAGIGGLAAALDLARRGNEVTVFERASAFGEVGAGIQVSPNAARVLHQLGTTTLGDGFQARYGLPYVNVARPDIVDILGEAVAASSVIDVRFGVRVSGVTVEDDAASVRLVDDTAETFDAVVGCDGIHSVVRSSVLGEQPSRFSNTVAYRALVPRERVEHLPVEVTNRLGPDRHVVSYFIGRDRRHLNLVFIGPEERWDTESWTEPGSLDELRSLSRPGWSHGRGDGAAALRGQPARANGHGAAAVVAQPRRVPPARRRAAAGPRRSVRPHSSRCVPE